ncbi:putative transposase [Trichonephila clavipes]|nr:putative transposase [Trichonephila clavipes]
MPRASTKVFKKRRGVFNKERCNKSNDGCGESNSTVPKNSADEKNCADGAKLCTNETEPSASERKIATRETCEHSMAEAVREAVDENDGKRDLAVAVDGSWQKRGFSSKNGLVTVTSVDTGKVIDVEVFQNIVFVRTKPSIFKIVREILKATAPLCGRNRLTEAEIDRLQAYYGLAIRRNLSSVKDMQQAIWAIFLHKLSTDEKPQHGFCPSDTDTWCKFKKAELLGETYHHKNSLPVDVVEAMRPVFRDLANPELLKSVYMEEISRQGNEMKSVVCVCVCPWIDLLSHSSTFPKAPRRRRLYYLIGHTCEIFTDARAIYHNNERDTCNCVSVLTIGLEKEVTYTLVALHFKYDQARRRFVEWAQNEIAVVPDFHKRILFSDEAHFWLNGYVNTQNCRIWSEANPQVYVETPLHPEKLTVWCALWAGGIIGPYFKNDEGHNVTVNGDRYRAMITNFFIPELNNHDVQELWFQQDGATCHTARATIDLLKDTFGDRLISRFGSVNWPPRSCDLTPLDYFLWVYVKSLVYADKPQALDHLEDNIRRVIADIRPQMLEKVIENWTSRLDYIRASRGSPMPEVIFKM